MSLDGIAIHAITDELSHILIGGRVDKVQQPDATTVISRENWQDIVWPLPVGDLLFVTLRPPTNRQDGFDPKR